MADQTYTLGEIAKELGVEFRGDHSEVISGVGTLIDAQEDQLAFYDNIKYKKDLKVTNAKVVIISESHAENSPVPVLISDKPSTLIP